MMDQIVESNENLRRKNCICCLCMTSCNQSLPSKIKNRIISRSVENPLETDAALYPLRVPVFLET